MPDGFFDTHKRLTAQRAAARKGAAPITVSPSAAAPATGAATDPRLPSALTVFELTQRIDKAIRVGLPANVLVRGEISNCKPRRAGHLYFTLKDAQSCIDCVMWENHADALKFTPQDGMEVVAGGQVKVYVPRGKHQLYVNTLSPLGRGALEIAFAQMRERLEKQGLFDRDRKRPLPSYPLRIAIVTSQNTAALQDMLKIFRRFAFLKLGLFHVPVQGDGAAAKIADAIAAINSPRFASRAFDAIVVSRGGGSLEDLWPFNEEPVARAIFASAIPVITGIGHEVDVSIADLVADYHAHTPTEAARVLTANWDAAADAIDVHSLRLSRAIRDLARDRRRQFDAIERHEFFRRPQDIINNLRQLLDDRQRDLAMAAARGLRRQSDRLQNASVRLLQRHPRHAAALVGQRITAIESAMNRAIKSQLSRENQRLDAMAAQLRAIGPDQVLARGYTMTLRKDGTPIKRAAEVRDGQRLTTRFVDGSVESIVDDSKQPGLFE